MSLNSFYYNKGFPNLGNRNPTSILETVKSKMPLSISDKIIMKLLSYNNTIRVYISHNIFEKITQFTTK